MLKCRGEVQSGKTLHHDLDPPGTLRISEAADEPRCGRKAYLAIRVELNCLRCRATAVLSMPVPRAGLEATSFQHRPRAVWYSDQVQTVRPSTTAMAILSMRNDARFDTDQTSTASRRRGSGGPALLSVYAYTSHLSSARRTRERVDRAFRALLPPGRQSF